MQIYTKGSTRKTQKIVKDLTRFCAEMLMSKRMADSLLIRVEFIKDLDNQYDGDCEYVDEESRPKEFLIRVNDALKLSKKLRTICHEMVHVKQYATGEMRYMWRPARHTKFQGTLYPDEVEYWDSPWEIEAFGREPGLYTRWIDQRGYAKNIIFDTRHIEDDVTFEELDFLSK
jgi:hypothetical protein